ncbi:hypothetical protein LTS17_004667 [Exophiala oligosperma]
MDQYLASLLVSSTATILCHSNSPFIALFIFRYLRLIVHIVSFWCYKHSPIPAIRTITERDVTVIIPTVEPTNYDFQECLSSVLMNGPATVHIVTVGPELHRQTCGIVRPFVPRYPSTNIKVSCTMQANKRKQIAHVLPHVQTALTVLVDDHVFWPSGHFLSTTVAPFENPAVGAVGTNKRVRRHDLPFGLASFFNVLGALYLERHNFEIRATNALDGGVFVISGRTCAYRTQILQSPEFLRGYLHETFFFGRFGPLNADDDNYITRAVVKAGWKIKIQYNAEAMIETTVGTYPKFLSQCLRWARTTWRSNPASLRSWTVWRTQPWCVYAVYLTSMVNFALFYDAVLFWTLSRSDFVVGSGGRHNNAAYAVLGGWILATKMVKLVSYFLRHPWDLVYLPGTLGFAYFHSLIKLYALCTFWVTAWGGRDLDSIGVGHDSTRETQSPVEFMTTATESRSASALEEEYRVSSANGVVSSTTTTDTNLTRPYRRGGTSASGRQSIMTPWGRVTPESAHLPANVQLDTRAQTRTRRRQADLTDCPDRSNQTLVVETRLRQQQQPVAPRLEGVDGPDDEISPLDLAPGQEQDWVRGQGQLQLATPALTPPPPPTGDEQPCPVSGRPCRRVCFDPYSRVWVRANCQRLHYNGLYIGAGGGCDTTRQEQCRVLNTRSLDGLVPQNTDTGE